MPLPEYVNCFYYRCGKAQIEETYVHDYHQLVIITAGEYRAHSTLGRISARKGDVVFWREGTRYRDANIPTPPLEFYAVLFREPSLTEALPNVVRDVEGRMALLAHWLNQTWWWEWARSREYKEGILHALLVEFLHMADFPQSELTHTIRDYIRAHLDESITLADMAEHVHLCRTHFARKFQQVTGYPPMEEVRRMRTEHAVSLLCTTDRPLKSIASAIGLSDEFSLSHFLKKRLGRSPRELRANQGLTRAEMFAIEWPRRLPFPKK